MMAPGPADMASPFRHAAAIYGTDEEFLSAVVPFVEDALAHDHPLIVALSLPQQALLTATVGSPPGVVLRPRDEHYAHPVSAVRDNRELFESHLRAGASRVRLLGDLPRGRPMTWRGWARYEALCNRHLADLPVSALCTYDRRNTSDEVLADVRRLHSMLATVDGDQTHNADYVEPESFLDDWSSTAVDPLESGEPAVTLTDPTPSDGRRAVARVAAGAGVDPEGIVGAVSEVLANAHVHGQPPVMFRAWSTDGRVVATVTDAGPGPSDPFSGLLAPDLEATRGRGLWIAHHLCDLVSISSGPDGCLVRLVAESDETNETMRRS